MGRVRRSEELLPVRLKLIPARSDAEARLRLYVAKEELLSLSVLSLRYLPHLELGYYCRRSMIDEPGNKCPSGSKSRHTLPHTKDSQESRTYR